MLCDYTRYAVVNKLVNKYKKVVFSNVRQRQLNVSYAGSWENHLGLLDLKNNNNNNNPKLQGKHI